MKRQTGKLVTTSTVGETVRSFVPYDLPPTPPIDLSGQILEKLGAADRAMGRLDGMARLCGQSVVSSEAFLSGPRR